MQTNRRHWIKQISLGAAGLGLTPLAALATPVNEPNKTVSVNADLPVKLSSNENPYGPSPLAKKAMVEHVGISNRYNWEMTNELVNALAARNGVAAENILMGAGSTEIIDLVARYAAGEKGSLIVADPTYAYWTDTAQKLGLQKISIPLTADKKHDLVAMLHAILPDTRLLYICNPNNPSGTICERTALLNFISEASKKAIVLVDEAYIDFTTETSVGPLVADNKNLIVAKTFSKIYGLAGARVGYAIGHTSTLEKLGELQSWANGSISVVSTAAALASLNDRAFVKNTYDLNEKTKTYSITELERLGIPCIPSHSNFIYFSLANYKKDFFEQLKKRNILGTKIYEENGAWSRITVGTMSEMQQFIAAIA